MCTPPPPRVMATMDIPADLPFSSAVFSPDWHPYRLCGGARYWVAGRGTSSLDECYAACFSLRHRHKRLLDAIPGRLPRKAQRVDWPSAKQLVPFFFLPIH